MSNEPEMREIVAERPPDTAVAREAIREARRRLLASQGIVRMILGAFFFTAFAVVRATTACKTEANMKAVMLLVVALIALQVLLPPIINQWRRSHGLAVVSRLEGQTVRFFSHPGWLALLAILAVSACVLIVLAIVGIEALHIPPNRIAFVDTAVAFCCTALLAGLYVARGLLVRMWEEALMAAGVVLTGLCFAFLREQMRLEIMAMLLAIAVFASGLSLHFRWRRWTQALPTDADGASRQDATP